MIPSLLLIARCLFRVRRNFLDDCWMLTPHALRCDLNMPMFQEISRSSLFWYGGRGGQEVFWLLGFKGMSWPPSIQIFGPCFQPAYSSAHISEHILHILVRISWQIHAYFFRNSGDSNFRSVYHLTKLQDVIWLDFQIASSVVTQTSCDPLAARLEV